MSSDKKVLSWLMYQTAQKVLPILEPEKPLGNLPENLLEIAKNLLTDTIDQEAATRQINLPSLIAGGYYVDDDISTRASYAIEAPLLALAQVQNIKLYTYYEWLQEVVEAQIEQGYPDEMFIRLFADTASSAVCAYSGISFDWNTINNLAVDNVTDSSKVLYYVYNTFNPEYVLEQRREFWEWWLTEAIPQAWKLSFPAFE